MISVRGIQRAIVLIYMLRTIVHVALGLIIAPVTLIMLIMAYQSNKRQKACRC